MQLYKQHFAADHADEDEDDADGTPEADEDGKEGRKRQACPHPAAAHIRSMSFRQSWSMAHAAN